jgi:large subunit ribosomal protein L32
MGLPKRRHSNTRTRLRRTHDFLTVQNLSNCVQCGSPVLPHRVCGGCGYYKGRQVLTPKVKKEKKKK